MSTLFYGVVDVTHFKSRHIYYAAFDKPVCHIITTRSEKKHVDIDAHVFELRNKSEGIDTIILLSNTQIIQ